MKITRFILIILVAAFLHSCFNDRYSDRVHLIDYYYLYAYSENNYELKCKMGCDGEITIPSKIREVRLAEDVMIVERSKDDSWEYYIIKAKGEKLQCCNDELIGPLTLRDARQLLQTSNVLYEKMKVYP